MTERADPMGTEGSQLIVRLAQFGVTTVSLGDVEIESNAHYHLHRAHPLYAWWNARREG